uniref:Uncharacterized protein n=1 Tax=Rhizophora mucronata TaxID=61149 RepID=A0A2P2MHS2_RHIMU
MSIRLWVFAELRHFLIEFIPQLERTSNTHNRQWKVTCTIPVRHSPFVKLKNLSQQRNHRLINLSISLNIT